MRRRRAPFRRRSFDPSQFEKIMEESEEDIRKDDGGDAAASGSSRGKQTSPVPKDFLCPISSVIMREPVVISSGETYDRASIQDWLDSGNRTCPRTEQALSNTTLIPNHLVHRMIFRWCFEHGIQIPPAKDDLHKNLITSKEQDQLKGLLDRMSISSKSGKKKAVKDFRQITKHDKTFRAVLTHNPDALAPLLSVLQDLESDPEVQENGVTTILNLSLHESNRKIIGDSLLAIQLLINALKGVTMDARANAAAALSSISTSDSVKLKIVETGAMKPLVELLQSGSPGAKKDVLSAIFKLCMPEQNRAAAVRSGAVDVLLQAISSQSRVDESLATLALISSESEVVEAFDNSGGMSCLLKVIKDESSSELGKENSMVILYWICIHDETKLSELELVDIDGCISKLAHTGTPRARRRAAAIVNKWKKKTVDVLLQAISNQSRVDESLATLALIANESEVVEAFDKSGGMSCLLKVIKDENSTDLGKENSVAILCWICIHDETKLNELELADVDGCISKLAHTGTPTARRRAAAIVNKWKKKAVDIL